MTAKKKTPKIESMTIEQFKTFIKGLSFFDANWTPSKEQWEHIKALIDNLKVDAPTVVQHVVHAQPAQSGINLPNNPNQGEAFTGETVDPRAGQRNFLGGQQPMGQPQQRGFDKHGNPVAVNPNTTERIGTTTVLPSAIGQQSDFAL